MDDKLTLLVAGNDLTFSRAQDERYLRELVTEFNESVSEIQLSHVKATKIEAILMSALNALDDKKKLEKENAALKRENDQYARRLGINR